MSTRATSPSQEESSTPPSEAPRAWTRVLGFAVGIAVVLAYQKTWSAGFIWDDNGHVTRPDLRSLGGLWRIWFVPGATQQYYPLLHSFFWLEYRLWGGAAYAYHLVNLGLHLAVAGLLYRVLVRLEIPGALLAAAVFALHPVCAESVAWISEQKNTLSAVFFLASALAYLRFDASRSRRAYFGAATLFVMALLTKSVTATLPAALLVVLWWKRGRLSLRADILPLVPWLLAAAAAGAVTAWMERAYIGASGAVFNLGSLGRILVAGRALWFYLGKLLWPTNLAFIYPHWDIDTRSPLAWLFPAAAMGAIGFLYAKRSVSRGPLAAALLFAGILFPALGFINVYPFIYSYVADHFQYLAAASMIAALAAGAALATRRLAMAARIAASAVLCGVLCFLTWNQCSAYTDMRTLWETTLEKNPDSWMARDNLGIGLAADGRLTEAVAQYERALELNPAFADTHNNLGAAFMAEGRVGEAVVQFRRTLELKPDDVEGWNNLGKALAHEGLPKDATAAYARALQLEPRDAEAEKGLGSIARGEGRMDLAMGHYLRATQIDSGDADAWVNLGNTHLATGSPAKAEGDYRTALGIDPHNAEACENLGAALLTEGRRQEAIAALKEGISLNPGGADAHYNLGNALLESGNLDEAVTEFRKALQLNPKDAGAERGLGTALFRQGHVDEALDHMGKAQAR